MTDAIARPGALMVRSGPIMWIEQNLSRCTWSLVFPDGSRAELRQADAEDTPRATLFADMVCLIFHKTGHLPRFLFDRRWIGHYLPGAP